MKTLHLIRHAKSSWLDSAVSDINRPLAQRGINDCQIMAAQLIEAGWNHQNIYCSEANRAQLTIAGIANALPRLTIVWQVDPKLYTFSSDTLLGWLSRLNNDCNEVTLVGHNPGFTDLINQLCGTQLANLPTCSYAQLSANIAHWGRAKNADFQMVKFRKPKMFK